MKNRLAQGTCFLLSLTAGFVLPLTAGQKPKPPAPAATPAPQINWEGFYVFEEFGSRQSGQFVLHTVKITKKGNTLTAVVDSEGLQIANHMACDTKIEGNTIHIFLNSYGKDNIGEPYQPNERLFTLEKTPDGKVLTYWGALKPQIYSLKSGGAYFRKEK